MTVNGAVNGAAARKARELLQQERRTRIAQLAVLEHEDAGTPDEESLARRGALQGKLVEIDAALTRLDDGTYGLCEDCGEPLPEGRLEILPHARRCVRCQRRRR